jgi:hypothetical protein
MTDGSFEWQFWSEYRGRFTREDRCDSYDDYRQAEVVLESIGFGRIVIR